MHIHCKSEQTQETFLIANGYDAQYLQRKILTDTAFYLDSVPVFGPHFVEALLLLGLLNKKANGDLGTRHEDAISKLNNMESEM